jgi:hypothetical protein
MMLRAKELSRVKKAIAVLGTTAIRSALVTLGAIAAVGILAAAALRAQPQEQSAQNDSNKPNPALEGDWVRSDTVGVGNFGGLGSDIPKAQLTTEGQALAGRGRGGGRGPGGPPAAGAQDAPHGVGQPYIVVARPCADNVGDGSITFNPDSGGFHLIVSKTEVVFSEERGGSRIIYIDGRQQPDPKSIGKPAGHSIGHWENGVLVVDTVGVSGGRGVAGGGVRTLDTHLTERFELSPDGKHMKIQYTYNDPKLYVTPHTYAYTFDRDTSNPSYAFEDWCDASDPIETQSIVPPAQQ